MADVTITLPTIPPEVDPAEMLRAIAAKIADGCPLDGLHAGIVRNVLDQLADRASVDTAPPDEPDTARREIPIQSDACDDDLATEKAAHEATRDRASVADVHRAALGVVADAARNLCTQIRRTDGPEPLLLPGMEQALTHLTALERSLDDLDMEETQ